MSCWMLAQFAALQIILLYAPVMLRDRFRPSMTRLRTPLKKEGILPHHHEGTVDSGWLLLDYGNVIVHIFATFEREYYQLDKLWHEATLVLRIQ